MNRIKRCITVTMFLALATNICANYKMSKSGRESIKKYENCSLVAYWDSNGYSIGYGHHSKNVKRGMKISKSLELILPFFILLLLSLLKISEFFTPPSPQL